MSEINIEWELDQWEWQGTVHNFEVDAEEFRGMSDDEITNIIHQRFTKEGRSMARFVFYDHEQALQDIRDALNGVEVDEDEELETV
jgi:hypothetical protein